MAVGANMGVTGAKVSENNINIIYFNYCFKGVCKRFKKIYFHMHVDYQANICSAKMS